MALSFPGQGRGDQLADEAHGDTGLAALQRGRLDYRLVDPDEALVDLFLINTLAPIRLLRAALPALVSSATASIGWVAFRIGRSDQRGPPLSGQSPIGATCFPLPSIGNSPGDDSAISTSTSKRRAILSATADGK